MDDDLPSIGINQVLSELEKDSRLDQLKNEIIHRFENELMVLVNRFKESDGGDEAVDVLNEGRQNLRGKLLLDILSVIHNRPNTINYENIFADMLEDLFAKQKSAEHVIDIFKAKIERINERRGLPLDASYMFDGRYFANYVDMLGKLDVMDKLIMLFDLLPFREQLLQNEIGKFYK